MIGRFRRAREVNDALRAWTGAHTAEEVVAACVEARVPATIVGNGAELPRFDHVDRARTCWCRSPASRGSGRARRSGSTAWPTASSVAPRDADRARRGRRARTRRAIRDAVGERPLAGVKVLDFTAFWAGPAATAWLCGDGRRRDQGRGRAATRRHPVQRDGAPERGSEVLRDVGAVPRVESRQARHHARPRPTRRARRSRGGSIARCDVVVENFTPRVLEQFGLDYDAVRAVRPDVVMVRMPAFGLDRAVARPSRVRADDGADHRHGVGDRLRRRAADHPGRPGRPDGRRARRARDRRRARAPRRAPATVSSSRCRSLEVATAVTAEQVIRYAIDGTLLDRRGTGGVYRALGDDAWVAVDLGVRSDARRGARRSGARRATPKRRPPSCARPASRPRRWCPGTRRSTTRRCGRAASSRRSTIRYVGAQEYPTWPMRMSAGPARFWTRPGADARPAHRRGAARRARCRPTTSSRACASEHVIGDDARTSVDAAPSVG